MKYNEGSRGYGTTHVVDITQPIEIGTVISIDPFGIGRYHKVKEIKKTNQRGKL